MSGAEIWPGHTIEDEHTATAESDNVLRQVSVWIHAPPF